MLELTAVETVVRGGWDAKVYFTEDHPSLCEMGAEGDEMAKRVLPNLFIRGRKVKQN